MSEHDASTCPVCGHPPGWAFWLKTTDGKCPDMVRVLYDPETGQLQLPDEDTS